MLNTNSVSQDVLFAHKLLTDYEPVFDTKKLVSIDSSHSLFGYCINQKECLAITFENVENDKFSFKPFFMNVDFKDKDGNIVTHYVRVRSKYHWPSNSKSDPYMSFPSEEDEADYDPIDTLSYELGLALFSFVMDKCSNSLSAIECAYSYRVRHGICHACYGEGIDVKEAAANKTASAFTPCFVCEGTGKA
jgi:hypothetical protein